MPPDALVCMDGYTAPDTFVPAPELTDWINAVYISDSGPFYTPEHAHLSGAFIGCLWTNTANIKQGRQIVGQAEMPERSSKGGKWQKARADQQLREWFGNVPTFLLTFDAFHAQGCDDTSFAALVDHELFHCAQAQDEFGAPKFSKETGEPVYCLRGHDVEEFVGVVRRFGIQAAGENAMDFVLAASRPPEIAQVSVAVACGSCDVVRMHKRVA